MFLELLSPVGSRGVHASAPPCFLPLADCPAGLMYGMAVYTTFRFPLADCWWNAHLTRLKENAAQLGLSLPFPADVIRLALEALIETEGCTQSVFRLTAIADVQEYGDFYTGTENGLKPARLLLSARKSGTSVLSSAGPLQSPVAVKAVDAIRPLPLIKHSGMADVIRLKQAALLSGFSEILLAQNGILREASTSNIFLIQAGQLLTPDPVRDGCLPGITRQRVLLTAKGLGIPVAETGPLLMRDLPHWDGAFLTNAAQGIRPVSRIDQHALPWPSEAKGWIQALAESLR